MSDYSTWKISRLELPASCNRAIRGLGVRTLGDLAAVTEDELLQRHQIGRGKVRQIQAKMEKFGLSLTKVPA